MNIETIVIIVLICLNLGLTLLSTRILLKSVISIDASLANAIQSTIENLPEALRAQYVGDIEAPNPFQMLIAKYFEDKIMNPSIQGELIEVKKGKDGKFI